MSRIDVFEYRPGIWIARRENGIVEAGGSRDEAWRKAMLYGMPPGLEFKYNEGFAMADPSWSCYDPAMPGVYGHGDTPNQAMEDMIQIARETWHRSRIQKLFATFKYHAQKMGNIEHIRETDAFITDWYNEKRSV